MTNYDTEEAEVGIRSAYASWQTQPSADGSYIPMTDDEAQEEFDRWLAEHDRQVAERAWGEGYASGQDSVYISSDEWPARTEDPYRKETT